MTPSNEISIPLTVKIHPDNLAKLEAWGQKYGITDRTELLERYIHKLATLAKTSRPSARPDGDSPFFPPDPSDDNGGVGASTWDFIVWIIFG